MGVRTQAAQGAHSGLPELVVDYTEIGLATRFVVPVTRTERTPLRVGTHVMLIGDSVQPREARVRGLCGRTHVDLEIVKK